MCRIIEEIYTTERLARARLFRKKHPDSPDFGVGDVIVPKQEKRKIPTQLEDFSEPAVNTYSLETTIAEKLMQFST